MLKLLAGDFNATLEECAFLTNLARGGWQDLGSSPTCLAAHSKEGRRIDLSVANLACGPMVSSYVTHWEVGLPTHAVQQWETARVKQPRVLCYSLSKGLGEGLWLPRTWIKPGSFSRFA